jgi:hypothetical protein
MSFIVPANSTHTLELELAPLAIKTYAFELPLLVRGISPLDLPQQLRAKLRRVVAAEACQPRVQMSVSSVNFGFQVNVSSHLAARNFSYAKQIELSNFDDKSPCKCTLRLVSADPGTVVGRPSAGTYHPPPHMTCMYPPP